MKKLITIFGIAILTSSCSLIQKSYLSCPPSTNKAGKLKQKLPQDSPQFKWKKFKA